LSISLVRHIPLFFVTDRSITSIIKLPGVCQEKNGEEKWKGVRACLRQAGEIEAL
jgi:hypothetical protein